MSDEINDDLSVIVVDDEGFADLVEMHEHLEESEPVAIEEADIEFPTVLEVSVEEPELVEEPFLKAEEFMEVLEIPTLLKYDDFNKQIHQLKELVQKHQHKTAQSHFKKFFKDADAEVDDRKTNYIFSRPGKGGTMSTNQSQSVAHVLHAQETSAKYQDAFDNINRISQILLKEVESGHIGILPIVPVKKTLKDKVVDVVSDTKNKIATTKRNVFFSLVNRAQKALNIK